MVIMVELPLLGLMMMRICPTPRLGQTLEGHFYTCISSFWYEVLGLGRKQKVHQYQGGDHIGAQRCTIDALVQSNWPGGTGRIPIIEGKIVNSKL